MPEPKFSLGDRVTLTENTRHLVEPHILEDMLHGATVDLVRTSSVSSAYRVVNEQAIHWFHENRLEFYVPFPLDQDGYPIPPGPPR